jgi:hypothetical protein
MNKNRNQRFSEDNDPPPEPPFFNADSVIDIIALVFSVWLCWTFAAKPVKIYVTEWLHSDQHNRPKDQQRLP